MLAAHADFLFEASFFLFEVSFIRFLNLRSGFPFFHTCQLYLRYSPSLPYHFFLHDNPL